MLLNIVKVYDRNGKSLFCIKNSGDILNRLKSKCFPASSLSTYEFSTVCTTLPYNLTKEKITELIEQTLNREGSLSLACNEKTRCFISEQHQKYKLWSYQMLSIIFLDNIVTRILGPR